MSFKISKIGSILDLGNDFFNEKIEMRALQKAQLSADLMLVMVFVSNCLELIFLIKIVDFGSKMVIFNLKITKNSRKITF